MSYYIYYILAVCCFIGELFTMEFSLTCLGIGAIGAGVVSWLGLGIWWQVIVFTVVASVSWLGVTSSEADNTMNMSAALTIRATFLYGDQKAWRTEMGFSTMAVTLAV